MSRQRSNQLSYSPEVGRIIPKYFACATILSEKIMFFKRLRSSWSCYG